MPFNLPLFGCWRPAGKFLRITQLTPRKSNSVQTVNNINWILDQIFNFQISMLFWITSSISRFQCCDQSMRWTVPLAWTCLQCIHLHSRSYAPKSSYSYTSSLLGTKSTGSEISPSLSPCRNYSPWVYDDFASIPFTICLLFFVLSCLSFSPLGAKTDTSFLVFPSPL